MILAHFKAVGTLEAVQPPERKKGPAMGDIAIQRLYMTEADLKTLGGGKVVFIKEVSAPAFREEYPGNDGIPNEGTIFVIFKADGTPTDWAAKRELAEGVAIAGGLQICLRN